VDYYYPRDRYYGHGPYFGESPLAIPGKVAGAALGLVTGVLGGAFFEDPYYSYRYSRDPYPGYQYYEEQSYGRDSGQYRIDRYYADRYNDEQYAEDRYRDERYRDERYSSKGYYEGGYYGSSYENNPYVSYYGGSYDASGVAACEREFQSFDRYTGTYITYAGEEVFCPYLRP
jgi:hypothetical protein